MTPKQIQTWTERVRRDIARANGNDSHYDKYNGQTAGPGWYIDCTDGHRALIRRGESTTEGAGLVTASTIQYEGHVDVDRVFLDALARMNAAAGGAGRRRRRQIDLSGAEDGILLATEDPDDGTQAREVVSTRWRPTFRAAVNLHYLREALAVGVRVAWSEDVNVPATVAEPTDTWRVVIMPMRPGRMLAIEREYREQTGASRAAA
jgi:hypothetical protein